MDNTEAIQRVVGQVVIDAFLKSQEASAHIQQLSEQIKELLKTNSQLQEKLNVSKLTEKLTENQPN